MAVSEGGEQEAGEWGERGDVSHSLTHTHARADEVGAVVFDIGTYTTKAGYAGEDTPKVRAKFFLGRELLAGGENVRERGREGGEEWV